MFKVFINFKTYPQGTGANAVELAKICGRVAKEKNIEIIPVVQVVDLYQVRQAVEIPVWVQSVDPFPPGKFTGFVTLESVVEAGASGVLLNHSEHQLPPGTIKQILTRVAKMQSFKDAKIKTMVCAKTLGQLERLVKLKPDFVGYEIVELIAGDLSITKANPKAVKHAVRIVGEIPLIVGAGIHKAEDLLKARQLGAKGVLISSAVVLAEDPRQKLIELLNVVNR